MGTLMRTLTPLAAVALLHAGAVAQGVIDIHETQYLLAPDINPFQEFGTALDVDGDTLVVGSPYDEDFGLQSGSAYVFVRSGGAWTFQAKFHSSAPAMYERFGSAVAVSGDVAVVGEPHYGNDIGLAHVYRRTGSTWSLETTLHASNQNLYWSFGDCVDVQGDRIAVGAPQRDSFDGSHYEHGSVYVFEYTGGAWAQTALLRASDGANHDNFGEELQMSGDTIVISAPQNAGGPGYAFVRDASGAWTEQAILVPPPQPAHPGSRWGESLAFEGDVAVLGSWRTGIYPNHYSGIAQVWRRSNGTWTPEATLFPDVDVGYKTFAKSIAVHGERIAVGMPERTVYGATGEDGKVLVFVHHAGVWTLESRMRASNGDTEDELGNAVAWAGDDLLAGAYHRWDWGIKSGAVYSCDLDGALHTYCTALPNSAGPGAWISATGSLSVSANDFTLVCSGLPPGSLGKFFYGTGQASAPIGNGLRCVGGSTFRLYPAVPADSTGNVTRHVDFTQAPSGVGPGAITPGSTWNFQYWHRNAAAGGAGFNLSDGLSATFNP